MSMKGNVYFPIRYKFLLALLFLLISSLSLFLYFAYRTFAEDKKLFVMDLNLSVLKSATSEIKAELKSRLEQIQLLAPRVYRPTSQQPDEQVPKEDPFQGLPAELSSEVIGVTFFRKSESGNFESIFEFKNENLLKERKLPEDILKQLTQRHPLTLGRASSEHGIEIKNRSLYVHGLQSKSELSVLTFLLSGNYVDEESQGFIIVVDLIQDFLRKKLQQSEVAELFLITRRGTLLSHPSIGPTIEFASAAYSHPIVEKIQGTGSPRESLELNVAGEAYLCNVGETSFKDVFAVSQIKKSQAFVALKILLFKSTVLAALILCATVIFSILFVGGLTGNIQKLKIAAEQIGTGNLNLSLTIKSNDEIKEVAESFQWMATRLSELISESVEKARMENELQTARLVQSTLLAPPQLKTDAVELHPQYLPASECGGDFWDVFATDEKVTLVIGDATGHGAAAAMVTAIAKSCLSTMNDVYADAPLSPEQILTMLNTVIYGSCKGQLLMTLCIAQLNVETGELAIANAGHESPLLLRAKDVISVDKDSDKKHRNSAEVLFARGERLGFDPTVVYKSEHFKVAIGDVLLLYTDGISEARNMDDKEWGERALKKYFTRGGTRPLPNIGEEMIDAMNEFTKGAPQKDDITFVLMSWRRKVIPVLKASSDVLAPSDPGEQLGVESVESILGVAREEEVLMSSDKAVSNQEVDPVGCEEGRTQWDRQTELDEEVLVWDENGDKKKAA